MTTECERLVAAYTDWLKAKIVAKDLNGVCEITTPFLDRHNDRLQIYVERTEHGMRLTDDGYIIADLEASGCSLAKPQRRQILRTLLNRFGVQEAQGELYVEASSEDFPKKKHALLQAMIAVNDMFVTARQKVEGLFLEDVQFFLESHDVRFAPNVEFTGQSGYVHRFDFVIPKSRQKPERLIRAINQPNRDTATALLFAWTDTKEQRPPNSVAYAILNDQEKRLSSDIIRSFEHYHIQTIPWSKREQFANELAA